MIDIEQPRNELVSLHDQCIKSQRYSAAREVLDHIQLLNDLEWAVKEEQDKLSKAIVSATTLASKIRKEMAENILNNQEKE